MLVGEKSNYSGMDSDKDKQFGYEKRQFEIQVGYHTHRSGCLCNNGVSHGGGRLDGVRTRCEDDRVLISLCKSF